MIKNKNNLEIKGKNITNLNILYCFPLLSKIYKFKVHMGQLKLWKKKN